MTTENTGATGGADDLDLFESEATGQPNTKQTSTTIPEKYSGKSVEDIIQMHQNAERKIGEQGREVATLRRLADEVIGLKKPTTQTIEERKPVTVDALLNDPEKAIRDAVANSDVARRADQAEARVTALEAGITEERFTAKHKDFASDINDPAFLAWVNKNPLRQALAQRTASKDFTAAQNLWDMWDEFKELSGTKTTEEKTPTQKARQVPTTVKSSPAEVSGRKANYSRAKVMEFKMRVQQGDPAALVKWNDPVFQQNLNQAYADGRVV